MPLVGNKKFSYTAEGKKKAKAFAKKTGKKMKSSYMGGGMMQSKKNKYSDGGIIQHD